MRSPVHDIVARALDDLGVRPRAVVLEVPEDLPDVLVDPGLLERVIVNVVANAQRYASDPPLLRAVSERDRVELRVIDTGPGIPVTDRDRVFLPFQRLGDTSTAGLGLGLALSRGLMEAMAGTLEPEDTPGGGLTMVISLPSATPAPPRERVIPSAASWLSMTSLRSSAPSPSTCARAATRSAGRERRRGAPAGRSTPAGSGAARPRATRSRRNRCHCGAPCLDDRAYRGALGAE